MRRIPLTWDGSEACLGSRQCDDKAYFECDMNTFPNRLSGYHSAYRKELYRPGAATWRVVVLSIARLVLCLGLSAIGQVSQAADTPLTQPAKITFRSGSNTMLANGKPIFPVGFYDVAWKYNTEEMISAIDAIAKTNYGRCRKTTAFLCLPARCEYLDCASRFT